MEATLWAQYAFLFQPQHAGFRSAARFTTQYIRGEIASLTCRLLLNGRGKAERCGEKVKHYFDLELSLSIQCRSHNFITAR